MNSKYEITPSKFSSLVKQITDSHTECINSTGISCTPDSESTWRWIETLPIFVKERQKNKCLGYVFDMIANQGCRSYRDKFIGASALLEVPGYSTELPQTPQEACLWLSERRLEGNDFSPLLLHPSNELRYDKARWLKGHTTMTSNMWGLGVQTQPARVAPRLQDHTIYLESELVGRVTNTFSWELRAEDKYSGFSGVLPHLVKLAGGSASSFVESLERIYPSQFLWTAEDTGNGYHFPGLRYEVPQSNAIETTLESLLKRYSAASSMNDIAELGTLCDAIIALLELSTPPTSPLGPFRNVGRLQLYGRLCDSSECTLILASCPTCDKITLFRTTLWQEPKTQAQLYLIPGLSYQYSVPSGMGIVIEDEEIIGRVRFGSSACNCNSPTLVKLS
jgi:hypothetical protein